MAPVSRLPRGCDVLLVLPVPARLHLGWDGWQAAGDLACEALGEVDWGDIAHGWVAFLGANSAVSA